MINSPYFSSTPWDSHIFGMPCFEITKYDEETCQVACENRGHYTLKVDPLANKKILHMYGFYYTDTLIEPHCSIHAFKAHQHPDIACVEQPDITHVLAMCDHSFLHGRFHRDFLLHEKKADQRYKQWLSQLYDQNHVLGLTYQDTLAGFIAYEGENLLLHTISTNFRGRGLAKFFWSQGIEYLFTHGVKNIKSSISASNLAVLNLYISLGFRFQNPVDIYHKITR